MIPSFYGAELSSHISDFVFPFPAVNYNGFTLIKYVTIDMEDFNEEEGENSLKSH